MRYLPWKLRPFVKIREVASVDCPYKNPIGDLLGVQNVVGGPCQGSFVHLGVQQSRLHVGTIAR